MNVEKDFEEFFALLNKHKVRYCVVGAYAVAYHGMPRATGDIDVLVEPDLENAKKIIRALREFGFGALKLTEQDFCRKNHVVQLGVPPLRIDLLTSISGVDFERVWNHRVFNRYGRQKVWVMGRRELLVNKGKTGRPKDKLDVESLKNRKPNIKGS